MKRSSMVANSVFGLFTLSFVVLTACNGGVDYGALDEPALAAGGSAGSAGADSDGGGTAGADSKPRVCDPGSSATCKCGDASGTKKCLDDGSAYGECSCEADAGPDATDGSPNVCDPGIYMPCKCGELDGNKRCKQDGSGFDACVCESQPDAGICVPGEYKNTNCCPDGKSGTQQCKGDASGWGECLYCAQPDAGPTKCGQYEVGQVVVSPCCPGGKDGKQVCQSNGILSECMDCPPNEQHKYYADDDADGDGDPNDTLVTTASTPPAGYVDHDGDCDDHDKAVFNGSTNACDCAGGGKGTRMCVNGGWTTCNGCSTTQYTYFADDDHDGLGNPNKKTTTTSSTPPTGYVANADDCDDTNAAVGSTGSRSCVGAGNCSGTQTCSNGVWNSCVCGATYTYYPDADNDNYVSETGSITVASSTPPAGYKVKTSGNAGDCMDNDPAVHPGVTEVCDNGKDDNCDGTFNEGCNPQDGGNTLVTLEAEYDGPDWTVPVIYGSWNGQEYLPLGNCTQTAHHVKCTFQVYEIDVNSVTLQVKLGSGRYWGDVSGNPPAPCKTPSEMASIHQASVTVIGTLTLKANGAAKPFNMCGNGTQKPSTCATCCASSGTFPYYNAVVGECP